MMFKTFRIGGIHPEENKITADIETCVAELPQEAFFPLSQHIGAPAVPIVKKGLSTGSFFRFGHCHKNRDYN